MKQTEQEKADYLIEKFSGMINCCIMLCDRVIKHDDTLQPQKDYYQRVKQILIKQK